MKSSDVRYWGVGINQSFEKSGFNLYAAYRHQEAEVLLGTTGGPQTSTVDLKDIDLVMTGAFLKF